MKRLCVLMVTCAIAVSAAAEDQKVINTEQDRLSYTLGLEMGLNLKKENIEINPELYSEGMKDAIGGKKPALSSQEMRETLLKFQQTLIAKRQAEHKQLSEENKKAGDAFLAANKKKPGVVTLSNGLQYKVLHQGKGKKPSSKDTVDVTYTGRLINGQVFDSTDRAGGKPVSFRLDEVIPGWSQALKLMPVGSKWEVVIPSDLAYGERGLAAPIGPNQVLIFEVELHAIKK